MKNLVHLNIFYYFCNRNLEEILFIRKKMKKLFLYKPLLVALAFLCLANQQLSAQYANGELKLTNEIDSLSFKLGIAQSSGLKEFLAERMSVDTAYMSDFCRGLYAGIQSCSDPSQTAFYAGIQIGQQISNQMIPGVNQEIFGSDESKGISMEHFLAGFVMGIDNSSNEEFLSKATEDVQERMEKVKESNITPELLAYKKKNEDWLTENLKKPDVHTLPSGVQYKIIKRGKGKKPTEDSEVECHYEGRLIDGEVFDSSYDRNETNSFSLESILPGWTYALLEMPVGSIWEVYIPQELAYGSREAGQIKPYSTLIFKIELISIKQ